MQPRSHPAQHCRQDGPTCCDAIDHQRAVKVWVAVKGVVHQLLRSTQQVRVARGHRRHAVGSSRVPWRCQLLQLLQQGLLLLHQHLHDLRGALQHASRSSNVRPLPIVATLPCAPCSCVLLAGWPLDRGTIIITWLLLSAGRALALARCLPVISSRVAAVAFSCGGCRWTAAALDCCRGLAAVGPGCRRA
jgi:hypothetical protein